MLRLSFHSSQICVSSVVVSILDGVIRSARQVFANLRPLVSQKTLFFEKNSILLFGPGSPLQVGVQNVDVSLTHVFASSTWQSFCNIDPLEISSCNHRDDEFVLFFLPVSTNDTRFQILQSEIWVRFLDARSR